MIKRLSEKSVIFSKTAIGLLALFQGLEASAADRCESLFGLALSTPVALYQTRTKSVASSEPGVAGKVSVLGDGSLKEESELKDDAEIVARVANELGLAVPPHLLHLAPSDQINILATTGGHAAPHWYDGATVVNGMKKAQGVLEFVTPGCPTCRAYYSASTPREEQRSIVMHVAGHNDMSATSQYARVRPSDGPKVGFELAMRLERAYREENRDEVSLFYQLIQSMMSLQDFVDGSFEDPSTFKPNIQAGVSTRQNSMAALIGGAPAVRAGEHRPWNKTQSTLQALSENLPAEAPQWQKDILRLYEQRVRVYPGNFQTQIMNEGWATLMMHLLARHTPWTQSKDMVVYAQLLSGVTHPSLSNPYYVGYTGWDNLYKQFLARPEIRSLTSEMEKDRQFILWARKFYEGKNDVEWARVALDRHWIEKHKMFLYRAWDPQTDEAYGSWDQERPYLALSRDWRRIQNHLIRQHVDAKFRSIPQIAVKNLRASDGFIDLVQSDVEGQPLEITSAAKTLFAMAQVMSKPTRMHLLLNVPESAMAALNVARYQMEVYPDGRVRFNAPDTNASDKSVAMRRAFEESSDRLSKQATAAIASYKQDLLMGIGADAQGVQNYRWTQNLSHVADQSLGSATQLVSHAPTYSAAIREYLQMVESRLRASLQAAMRGNGKLTPTASGVRLKVLPEVPSFEYDKRAIAKIKGGVAKAPVDGTAPILTPYNVDDNGTGISSGPYLPGDRFGKKSSAGQGKGNKGDGEDEGDGDGDGEGQDQDQGQPGDGSSPGQQPGNGRGPGGNEPHDLDIPLELYGEMLADELELQNIRRTTGGMDRTALVRRGSIRKTSGNLLWVEIMTNAVEKARAVRRSNGLPYDSSVPLADLVREALPLIEPSDYVVSGRAEIPRPDFEAVLVVNVDMTGSMSGERIAVAKNLVFNLKALLAAKYKKVNIVYVGFSDTAHEMSEKDIFSKFISGGTAYASASKKDQEIFARYPNSKFNKYAITVGDAETSTEDAQAYVNDMRTLSSDLQYAAFAATNERETSVKPFFDELSLLESEWPWHGKTIVANRDGIFKALRELFPKAGKKKE